MQTTSEIIIRRVEAGYTEILALCQNVPGPALIEPSLPNDCSMKDTVAHIAAWIWRCSALLEAAHSSDGPLKAQPDVDGLNREFYQERREWSWSDVEADFRQAHLALLTAIHQLPPKRLENVLVQRTIAGNTWEHYAEHWPDLKRCYDQVVRKVLV